MPNWCLNHAQIKGSKDQLDALENSGTFLLAYLNQEVVKAESRHLYNPEYVRQADDDSLTIYFNSAWDSSTAIEAFKSAIEAQLLESFKLSYVEPANQVLGVYDSDYVEIDLKWPTSFEAIASIRSTLDSKPIYDCVESWIEAAQDDDEEC